MAGTPSLGRVQLDSWRDFSGGLNLTDDQFNLSPNESPDLSNVNLLPRGGFELRQGVKRYGATGMSTVSTAIHRPFASAEGLGASGAGSAKYVFCHESLVAPTQTIWYTTGPTTNWTSLSTYPTTTAKIRTVVIAPVGTRVSGIYFNNGVDVAQKWDGTTFAALIDPAIAPSYNEDFAVPVRGRLPKAKCVTMYGGSLWVGNLLENATAHPNRLRFSHPGEIEDWRAADFINVEPGRGGDQITALAVLQDRLLIFKSRSVYVLTGFDATTFQIVPLSDDIGAVSQEMVEVSEHGVFFYDQSTGVHLITPDGSLEYLFSNLRPAIDDGTIVTGAALRDYGSVVFANQKVYVSLPWTAGSTYCTKTLVYDLLLGKEGGWTAYDFNSYGAVVQRAQLTDDAVILGGLNASAARPFYLDVQDGKDLWDGSTESAIASYYVTAWFDAGQPAVQKRFRRPTFLCQNHSTGTLFWYSYEDFDPTGLKKSGPIPLTAIGTTLTYGPTGSSLIGTAVWAGPGTNRSSPLKGGTLGNAYAVQLKFVGPSEKILWGINQISYRFIMKRIR